MGRSALMDGDTGKMVGVLSGGARWSHLQPIHSPDGKQIYAVETHYSRTWRGDRTDIVAVYDSQTLEDLGEISIPAKHAFYPPFQSGSSALADGGRFLAAFNLTPATSLSLVDVKSQKFLSEVETPGCSMAYAAGDRQFAMLCADGSVLVVSLNEDGTKVTRRRSQPFFDPISDPITEKGARHGGSWVFASFEGYLHEVDVTSNPPRGLTPWSLFTDDERADQWRVGGKQHLAVNEPHGLLYSLVHQGGPDTHKDVGSEIWVYDLKSKKKLMSIKIEKPEDGLEMIAVSKDENPILFTAGGFPLLVSVYDARTGVHLRNVSRPSLVGSWLEIP
jgi:methylamine dehydrogenase heavy chain